MRREKCDSRECGPRAITRAQPRGALRSCSFLLLRFAQVPQDEAWDRGHGRRERAVSLRSPCAGDSRRQPDLVAVGQRGTSAETERLFTPTGCRTSTRGTGTSRKAGAHSSLASLPALRLKLIRIPLDRLYPGPSDGVQRAQQHCGRQTEDEGWDRRFYGVREQNPRVHQGTRKPPPAGRSIAHMTTYGNKLKGFLRLIGRNLRGLKPHILLDRSWVRKFYPVPVIQIHTSLPLAWIGWTGTDLFSQQWFQWLICILRWEALKPELV